MRRQPSTLLLVAVALIVGGCGGGSGGTTSSSTISNRPVPFPSTTTGASPPTSASPPDASARAKLIAQAEAICGRLNAELAASTSKQKSLAPAEIARFAPLNAALERNAIAELARLAPPASLARDWRAIVAYRRTLAKELAKLGQTAKANNRTGIVALLASKRRVRQQLLALAARDEFKECSIVGGAGPARAPNPSPRSLPEYGFGSQGASVPGRS
jgi:hypothetical protein